MFISNTNSLQSFLPEFWQWMLLWDEKRQTVEVIAACLGPSEQLVLCISWKKSSLIQGSPAAPWRHPAWGYELIQDNPWKHHISVAVLSPAGFNTEGPILNRNLLWKLFNMFFFKGSNLFCLLGFFPLELCLSFWHLTGMDPARTGTRARLISMHCGFSCSSACLEKAQCSSWAIDLSSYIICFTSSYEYCFLSACWRLLVTLTCAFWWDILAMTTSSPNLHPWDLSSSLPCMSPSSSLMTYVLFAENVCQNQVVESKNANRSAFCKCASSLLKLVTG